MEPMHTPLEKYLMHFYSAWIHFVGFSLRRIVRLNSPLCVFSDELLGRAIFSGHISKKTKKLLLNAFEINQKAEFEISLSRLDLAPRLFFDRISAANARKRRISFYGFGEFRAESVRKISIDADKHLNVCGAPTIVNPFHAVVPLIKDREKDYYMAVAKELLDIARFTPYEGLP
jgi:hypothetical protein